MKTKRILHTMATLVATTVLSAPPVPPPAVPSAPAPGAQPSLPPGVVAIPATPTPGSQRTLPPGVVAVPAAPAPSAAPGPAGPAAPVVVSPAPAIETAPSPAAVAPQLPPGTWIGSITGNKVNARGRATVFSYSVFSFNKDEPVLVLGAVTLPAPKAGDPRKWLRIQVPANVALFVHKSYIANIHTIQVPGPNGQPVNIKVGDVKASRLNVRAGAGEKYPKLGSIPRGATVQLTDRPAQGNWMEILAPETTEVFVAAQFVAKYQGPMTTGTPGTTPGVVSNPVTVPDPITARFPSGTGQPNPVAPTPPRPQRPKPMEIISIPIKALGISQPGANDPNEAFPAPPIPVKRSKPTGPRKGTGQPQQPPGTGRESGKIISPGVAKPAPTPKPEINAKPTPEKVEVKGAKPPTPAAPTSPVKPAENSKPAQPDGSAKPNETSKVKPAETPKPVEVAKVKPTESAKRTQSAEQNKVTAKPVKPVTKPTETAKPERKKPVRIVTREGYVQRTLNIQSPTPYVLEHLATGKVINYLYLNNPKLPLKLLRGRRILVTGEEAIDPRWLHTPVLKIQTLKTIDDAEITQGK